MLSSNLIRWGAIATILSGALSIFMAVSTNYNLVELARWALLGVGVVGLYLYLRRSSRFGWLGAVGCYTLIVGCVLNTIAYLGFVPSEGVVSYVAYVGDPLGLVGSVLFGVGILRAGSLPRAGAWLIIVSIPLLVIAIATTVIGDAHWTDWFFVMGEGGFGSGCIVLGYGLWSHRGEPIQTPASASPNASA